MNDFHSFILFYLFCFLFHFRSAKFSLFLNYIPPAAVIRPSLTQLLLRTSDELQMI